MANQVSQKTVIILTITILFSTIVLTNSSAIESNLEAEGPQMAANVDEHLQLNIQASPDQAGNSAGMSLNDSEKGEEDLDYEEDVSEENACEEEMFWHIRGAQCVPERCPNGRDHVTGLCLEDDPLVDSLSARMPYRNARKYRPWLKNKSSGRPKFTMRRIGIGKLRRPIAKLQNSKQQGCLYVDQGNNCIW